MYQEFLCDEKGGAKGGNFGGNCGNLILHTPVGSAFDSEVRSSSSHQEQFQSSPGKSENPAASKGLRGFLFPARSGEIR
jgi:hypothetical protein